MELRRYQYYLLTRLECKKGVLFKLLHPFHQDILLPNALSEECTHHPTVFLCWKESVQRSLDIMERFQQIGMTKKEKLRYFLQSYSY